MKVAFSGGQLQVYINLLAIKPQWRPSGIGTIISHLLVPRGIIPATWRLTTVSLVAVEKELDCIAFLVFLLRFLVQIVRVSLHLSYFFASLIRLKRIYFPEQFCYWFTSNLCILDTTNMD
jgi:hypothetical protein